MTEIRNLSFAYGRAEKDKPGLFASLSLDLASGGIYGLLGKNGAGKTTLLKIMCGLLFPTGGSCVVNGQTSARRRVEMLEELYFLPEEFDVPPMTPRMYARLYGPLYPRFDGASLEGYLRELEVETDRHLHRMSFGQKKKFLLAFGLATRCRLLLLDEPTNGLDIPSKSQFRRLVASAFSEERVFLISTQQARDMQDLIDPIIILEDGEVIFQHSGDEVSRHLTVRMLTTEPVPEEFVYVEKVPGGYTALARREEGEQEARIDLELLFNAVTQAPEAMRGIVEQGGAA